MLDIVPTPALNDHVTVLLLFPLTVATNAWVCELPSVTVDGVIDTPLIIAGFKKMEALAYTLESVALLTITLTVRPLVSDDGAE